MDFNKKQNERKLRATDTHYTVILMSATTSVIDFKKAKKQNERKLRATDTHYAARAASADS
jgi:hypothetical protein